MSIKRIVAVTMTEIIPTVIVTAVIWTYLIATYESDLGTSNVIEVSTENSISDSSDDNQLVSLSFEEGAEDIAWSSLEINLMLMRRVMAVLLARNQILNHQTARSCLD